MNLDTARESVREAEVPRDSYQSHPALGFRIKANLGL